MRKYCALFLALLMIANISINISAEGYTTNTVVSTNVDETQPQIEFCPQIIDNSQVRANNPTSPRWVADTKLTHATSDSYFDNTYEKRWPIDIITVRFRAYYNNNLVCTMKDEQFGASHAAAGPGSGLLATERIGQHTFEEAGYERWEIETYE